MIAGSGAYRGVFAPNWIVSHRANRRREETRDLADVVCGRLVERDPDDFVRSLRERLAQHRLRALRARGQRDDPTSRLLLEPDALLERVLVRAVQLVVERVALDVLAIWRDLKLQIRIRDLFQAHDDVQWHGARA